MACQCPLKERLGQSGKRCREGIFLPITRALAPKPGDAHRNSQKAIMITAVVAPATHRRIVVLDNHGFIFYSER
jgi:hypothetical protein